ncbi:hypothetical protein C5O23_09735 [Duncaniella muris]|uniref:Uncharacterized protein n=1 Tax=Duncaniella muris TaxID=2094150 RepID=A0A2V1INZ8_9BACT|nr:hypothetical protein C5O23_09735 [Duncaniella muris]
MPILTQILKNNFVVKILAQDYIKYTKFRPPMQVRGFDLAIFKLVRMTFKMAFIERHPRQL